MLLPEPVSIAWPPATHPLLRIGAKINVYPGAMPNGYGSMPSSAPHPPGAAGHLLPQAGNGHSGRPTAPPVAIPGRRRRTRNRCAPTGGRSLPIPGLRYAASGMMTPCSLAVRRTGAEARPATEAADRVTETRQGNRRGEHGAAIRTDAWAVIIPIIHTVVGPGPRMLAQEESTSPQAGAWITARARRTRIPTNVERAASQAGTRIPGRLRVRMLAKIQRPATQAGA